MKQLITDIVEILQIKRPFRVTLQSKIKNKDWQAYHNAVVSNNGKILHHNIRISLQGEFNLETIIAHEFIHAWQMENDLMQEIHGKHFQRMAKTLESELKDLGYTEVWNIYRPDIDIDY